MTTAKADKVLGILAVNGWHNLVHIATGVLGLAVIGSYANARLYALGLGAVYLALGIIGLLMSNPDLLLDIVPLNDEDNVLHLLIGVAGLGAGLATPATQAPSTAATALAAQALLKVAGHVAQALLERGEAAGLLAPVALAGADQDERPGRGGTDDGRGHRAAPVARVAHRLELELGQLVGRQVGQLREPALEPVGQRLAGLDRDERASAAEPRRR